MLDPQKLTPLVVAGALQHFSNDNYNEHDKALTKQASQLIRSSEVSAMLGSLVGGQLDPEVMGCLMEHGGAELALKMVKNLNLLLQEHFLLGWRSAEIVAGMAEVPEGTAAIMAEANKNKDDVMAFAKDVLERGMNAIEDKRQELRDNW